MGIAESMSGAGGIFKSGLQTVGSLSWVFIPIVIVAIVGFILFIWMKIKKKKSQWTHNLKVRRVLQDNRLSDTAILPMRRFPLIKKAEVFELKDDGKSHVKEGASCKGHEDKCKDSAEGCPVNAITL